MKISAKQLVEILMNTKGATPVTIVAETPPSMRTKDNPFAGKVVKVTRVNGMINWSYTKAVNRVLEKMEQEPDFQAQPRAWGVRIPGTPLVAHKGQHYLELKVQTYHGEEYRDVTTGEVIPTSVLEPYLRAPRPAPVVLRDYDINNIRQISVRGDVYQVA